MSKFKKSLFIFRRDLRLEDNTALIDACVHSKEVIPCFIFDSEIMKSFKNSNLRIFDQNFVASNLLGLQIPYSSFCKNL